MRAGAVRACVLRGEGPAKSIALGIELCKCASCMLPTASYFGRVVISNVGEFGLLSLSPIVFVLVQADFSPFVPLYLLLTLSRTGFL